MSILVVDVGTSGVRAAVVRPDATVDRRPLPRGAARLARRPGFVEFDAAAMAAAALEAARASPGRGRPGRRRRHRQPAGVDHRVGPRHRRARRPGHRLAGPAHRRRLPGAAASRASASRPTCRPPRRSTSSTWPTPTAPATSASARSTRWIAWHLTERRRPRDRPDQRRAHRAPHRRRPPLERPSCSTRCASPRRACPRSSTRPGVVGRGHRARRRAADRRHRRRPAGVARRPGLRAAGPGQDHVRHRRHARPLPRRRAAGLPHPGRGRHVPDRRLEPRRPARPGASRRSCSRPAPTSSGCATTSASSPTPRPPTTSRRSAPTPRAWCSCPPSSASARRSGTTARGARCSASPGARTGPGSCGPCSRASPTAAPTWSRRPRPTAASPIPVAADRRRHVGQPHLRAGAGRRHAVARSRSARSSRPRPSAPACLAGLAVGTWAGEDDVAATWSPARVVEPARQLDRDRWADACRRAGAWFPELSALDF